MIDELTMDMEQPVAAPEQDAPVDERTKATVISWLARIKDAKKKMEPDFKRMRSDMEFVSGLQWPGQKTIADERYVSNIVLQLVKQKVASLYAKNPTAVYERRKRLEFQIWDGKVESLLEAVGQAQPILEQGLPLPPELSLFFQDVELGKMKEQLIERVGDTLEILYGYSIDSQKPEFKQQAKQSVRRTVICGVAYGRPILCVSDPDYEVISTIDHKSSAFDRSKRAKVIVDKIQSGEVDLDSAAAGQLQSLAASLGVPQDAELAERLEFDFPSSTSVIVDKLCRSLVDFVGARWIAQEYVLPLNEVNAIFQTKIKSGSGEGKAKEVGGEQVSEQSANEHELEKNVTLFEVFDYNTKTRFFLCEGWHDYVTLPEMPWPSVSGFWPIFALLFNEVESEPNTNTSIIPPSDVSAARSPQLEWNRSREGLRHQRNANAPVWMYRDGLLTEEDQIALREAVPNSAIGLKGIPPEMSIDQFFSRRPVAPIDSAMYDTSPLEQDLMMAGGVQQANIGPAQPNVTATVGSIAEQSRMNISASNIDDLDGWLSRMAQAGGEMLIQGMSVETVKKIAGPGAVWPDTHETRQEFLNEVYLKIEAASSGRPNKAIDVANWRDLAPLIMQSGGNPVGVIQETARRLDDGMDVTHFFPLLPPKSPLASSVATQPAGQPTPTGAANGAPVSSSSVTGQSGETSPDPLAMGGSGY